MLTLFQSNRFEVLLEALMATESAARSGPFAPIEIIVPSAAVTRRLELDWATRYGVCANVRCCYLAEWLWQQMAHLMTVPERSPLAPDALAWQLYALLGDATATPRADLAIDGRLNAYLSHADDGQRFRLARRLARVFDHYQTYRTDWLADWRAGRSIFERMPWTTPTDAQRDDERWQAALWRAVPAAGAPASERFLGLEPARLAPLAGRRVAVLALPTMAPLHVALLNQLSSVVDVGVYALNPCREYWFDMVGDRTALRLALAAGTMPDDRIGGHGGVATGPAAPFDVLADAHLDVGQPLLAEWGRQSRALLSTLFELTEGRVDAQAEVFLASPQPTLLAGIQNAILDLAPMPDVDPAAPAGVEVHVCHSLSRQLEVLHDRLLALFDTDPDLAPDDVLVTFPDLAAAAPLVDAVFGTMPDARRIPYRITGLPPSRVNRLARLLLSWLAMTDTPPGLAELIEWLRVEAFARAYGIEVDDIDAIQRALLAAGARAAFDDAPADAGPGHSLDDAVMRLVLGYAMPDDGAPQSNWLPVPSAGAQRWLGGLSEVCDDLGRLRARLRATQSAADWQRLLDWVLARFFVAEPAWSDDLHALVEACGAVFGALRGGVGEPAGEVALSVDVLRQALAAMLDESARGGVPAGGVTFAALPSLRLLPYRVICLLGMDDGALPSLLRADEFDLIAAFGRRGDRQRRDDERNLFLDLLLACRQQLLIAYTGRSIRDNAVLPPSGLVDELLDHCAQVRAGPGADASDVELARGALVTVHPLQPFSEQYLGPDAVVPTYDSDRAEVGVALRAQNDRSIEATVSAARQGTSGGAIFAMPLPPLSQPAVSLDAFGRFWRYPQQTLLRERLGIVFDEVEALPPAYEPFVADFAGRDALARRVLPALLDDDRQARGGPLPLGARAGVPDQRADTVVAGHDDERARRRALALAAASPELPGGATGAVVREREFGALSALASRVRSATRQGQVQLRFTLPLSLRWPAGLPAELWPAGSHAGLPDELLAPLTLTGALDGLTSSGRVAWRFTRPHPRALLAAWLEHLVLNALDPVLLQQALSDGLPDHDGSTEVRRETRWLGNGTAFSFAALDNAAGLLGELAALYRLGLIWPLPFYPKSGYARATQGPGAALSVFDGGGQTPGERDDPALRMACGPALGLTPAFDWLSDWLYDPLLAHLRAVDGVLDSDDHSATQPGEATA